MGEEQLKSPGAGSGLQTWLHTQSVSASPHPTSSSLLQVKYLFYTPAPVGKQS